MRRPKVGSGVAGDALRTERGVCDEFGIELTRFEIELVCGVEDQVSVCRVTFGEAFDRCSRDPGVPRLGTPIVATTCCMREALSACCSCSTESRERVCSP